MKIDIKGVNDLFDKIKSNANKLPKSVKIPPNTPDNAIVKKVLDEVKKNLLDGI